jgi:hypothetical protein
MRTLALPETRWLRNDCHTKWNGQANTGIVRDSYLTWSGIFRISIVWPTESV